MPCTITEKESKMNDIIPIGTLVLTLLNLGLVVIALVTLKGLRKDLRTPVVNKYNPDFKRKSGLNLKSVDIPKASDNFGKKDRDDRLKNRPKNNPQQNRPVAIRRPVQKAPDVFSNEMPIPPRPVAAEPAASTEGRRPLPPRSAAAATDLAPSAPLPVNLAASDTEESGMEFDRSKMAHGRRNMVAKPVIEDENE
jgi:hypothetical protein